MREGVCCVEFFDHHFSDDTVAIILEYTALLPITLEINPHNVGYIRNFERALAKAHGAYIAYCDAPLVRYRQHSSNTLSATKKVPLSLSEKIAMKTFKKEEEHRLRASIIDELLTIVSLTSEEQNILIALKHEHLAFAHQWFNVKLFRLLIRYRYFLCAITKRNPFVLAFKHSMGRKLYQLFPFL